jgi:hypothetical protein
MDIKRAVSQASGKGPAEYFTGTVRVDPLFDAPDPAVCLEPALPSSQERALHGTLTRWGRL